MIIIDLKDEKAILDLLVLIEKQVDMNKVTYLAFIYQEMTFDKKDWNTMLFTLQKKCFEQYD